MKKRVHGDTYFGTDGAETPLSAASPSFWAAEPGKKQCAAKTIRQQRF